MEKSEILVFVFDFTVSSSVLCLATADKNIIIWIMINRPAFMLKKTRPFVFLIPLKSLVVFSLHPEQFASMADTEAKN